MFTHSKVALLMLLGLAAGRTHGDVTRVEAMYVDGFSFANPLVDLDGTPLTAGGGENGDGAVIQIGYFQGVATDLDPSDFDSAEWRNFMPLTGLGSPNEERFPTSIGDVDSPGTGPFGFFFFPGAVALEFDPALDVGLPVSAPVRLGIRFYDGTATGNSTTYNTVTSDSLQWLLQPPAPSAPVALLDMDSDLLFWESGSGGAFQTVMVMTPEPDSVALSALALLAFLRRKRSVR